MKKGLLFLPLLFCLPAPSRCEEIALPDVRLTQTTGPVLLTLGGATGAPLISGEMPLEEGDVIVTSTEGTAEISFNEGTLLRLLPRGSLRLHRLSGKRSVVSLRYGVLLCRVEIDVDGGEEFSVITPAATISVKGTEFAVEHKERKSTIGVLNEGHVLVRVPGFRKEVLMRFNQETIVSKGSPPRDFRVLTQLYPHKVQMGEMRTRIKQLKRHETALTPQQRAMLRAGWKNTNALPPREKSAASAGKSSGTPSKQR